MPERTLRFTEDEMTLITNWADHADSDELELYNKVVTHGEYEFTAKELEVIINWALYELKASGLLQWEEDLCDRIARFLANN